MSPQKSARGFEQQLHPQLPKLGSNFTSRTQTCTTSRSKKSLTQSTLCEIITWASVFIPPFSFYSLQVILIVCIVRKASVSLIEHCLFCASFFFFQILFIYFQRGEGREKKRERNIIVWLPLTCPLLATWPATQAGALTGNRTGESLVHRPELNPLSYTSQGFTNFNQSFSFLI